MEKVKIKIIDGFVPEKGSASAAAYDLRVPQDIVLRHGRQIIGLGFCMELPHGYGAVIQARSGFTSKGLECQHEKESWFFLPDKEETVRIDADVQLGLIDEDYRDVVGVMLIVHQRIRYNEEYYIKRGTRIAQMRIVKIPETEMVLAEELDNSNDRGGGFGHTGAK